MFNKIKNSESVVSSVVNEIKKSIINGELKPGDKIPTEVELIEQFGVGRNSIREAIKVLTALGVLEVRRGQGTYIVEKVNPSFFDPLIFSMILEPKSNRDLYELRLLFDSMVLLNVIEKITDNEIKMLEEQLLETRQIYNSGEQDIDYFTQRDIQFHQLLMQFTKNPLIIRLGEAILGLFPKYIKKSISQEKGIERSINNHFAILEIIKEKDKNNIIERVENTLVEWKNEWKDE